MNSESGSLGRKKEAGGVDSALEKQSPCEKNEKGSLLTIQILCFGFHATVFTAPLAESVTESGGPKLE